MSNFSSEASLAESRVIELADPKNPTQKAWQQIDEKDGAVVVCDLMMMMVMMM